jgi:hypothetical protein
MKLLRQVTLTEFHKYIMIKHPIQGMCITQFWRKWYHSRIFRYNEYNQFLQNLKINQQQQLEQELWREIHGD